MSILSMSMFMASFSVGFGPVAWVLSSKVLSSSIRGKARSLATLTKRTTSGLCAITFLSLSNALTVGRCLLSVQHRIINGFMVLLQVSVPETKNRTVEEIQLFMKR